MAAVLFRVVADQGGLVAPFPDFAGNNRKAAFPPYLGGALQGLGPDQHFQLSSEQLEIHYKECFALAGRPLRFSGDITHYPDLTPMQVTADLVHGVDGIAGVQAGQSHERIVREVNPEKLPLPSALLFLGHVAGPQGDSRKLSTAAGVAAGEQAALARGPGPRLPLRRGYYGVQGIQ